MKCIEDLPALVGGRAVLRRGLVTNNKADGDNIAVTDNGNFIVDVFFDRPIADVGEARYQLDSVSGVVEHGLFSGLVTTLLIATPTTVRVVGEGGEEPYWQDQSLKEPLERMAVDARRPGSQSN